MNQLLSNREQNILNSIIQSFIIKASPVGSRYISKEYEYGMSPATIRNVMMDLEEKGFVIQPHTSAGRIPTDLGYRFYVDKLVQKEELNLAEKNQIREDLNFQHKSEVDKILEKACRALCQISNLFGVVLSPRFFKGKFKKLELVRLNENTLMVIISIESGLVKTITLEVKTDIKIEKLEETARILNENLYGLTLKEIRDTINSRLKDVSLGDKDLIQQFIDSADQLFILENDNIHFTGAQKIINQPEFAEKDNMQNILELIDNKNELVHILNEYASDEYVIITIGKENKKELMKNCSLIVTNYKIGSTSGSLGVIGPTRMNYPKMISLVDFIAEEISNLFKK